MKLIDFLFFVILIIVLEVHKVALANEKDGNCHSEENFYTNIPLNDYRNLISLALRNVGYSEKEVQITSETLLYAELRGNNQGIVKLLSGALMPNSSASDIRIIRESLVSALVDGSQRIGMAVVAEAVLLAVTKGKAHGVAVVAASNYSSATGAIGIWARKIANEGLVGIVMSQCPEMVAPYGSYEPIFGTNPIAIAVPSYDGPIVMDMATSAAAFFSLVSASREGETIPADIAYDDQGRETTDPLAAMRGALRVFDRSHKGSALALMIELLSGALTGASMSDKQSANNWGSLVIAIDPSLFGSLEEFKDRVRDMSDRVKNAKLLPGVAQVFLPGESGDRIERANLELGYLRIPTKNIMQLKQMAG